MKIPKTIKAFLGTPQCSFSNFPIFLGLSQRLCVGSLSESVLFFQQNFVECFSYTKHCSKILEIQPTDPKLCFLMKLTLLCSRDPACQNFRPDSSFEEVVI